MSTGIRGTGKKPAGSAGLRVFGARPATTGIRARPQQQPQRPQAGRPRGGTDADIPLAAATGLASPPDMRTSVEYTLVSTKPRRTHNVMRFQSPKPVDPSTFTAPVKLRRRNKEYYRLKNKKRNEERAAAMELEQANGAAGAAAPDQEKKDERPKADMSLIADVGGARSNKKNLFKKRTKQVYFADEEKRRLDIEEARPWVLEDDDDKEVWSGSLEGGQKAAHVLFVLAENGFKVVPVDRWYKFTPKQQFKTLTLEEAEAELQRAHKAESHDRWMMRKRLLALDENAEKEAAAAAQAASIAKSRSSLVEYEAPDDVFGDFDDDDEDGAGSSKRRKAQSSGKHGDADEFGFELEFDDDEELGDVQFEYNEDESIEKKEQQRNANRTSYDSDGDLDDEDENMDGEKRNSEAENMKKLMRKREGNADYDSDVEDNPYLSVSDYSDSDDDDQDDAKKDQPQTQQQPQSQQQQQATGATDQAKGNGSPKSNTTSATTTNATAAAAGPSSGSTSPTSPTSPTQQSTSSAAPTAARKRKRGPAHHSRHPATRATAPGLLPPSVAEPNADPNIITKYEVIYLLSGGVDSTKELIGCLRKKLKANPDNKTILQAIVKEVATLREGPNGSVLTLKNP